MKNKIGIFILLFLIIISIMFIIFFGSYVSKINTISNDINSKILSLYNDNNLNNEKLNYLKEKNSNQEEILNNINNYIDLLSRRIDDDER